MSEQLPTIFPALASAGFRVTRPADPDYNCIAWAAGDASKIWWPFGEGPRFYWPEGVPREETVEAFTALFVSLGYETGADEAHESDFEKVALFVNRFGVPSHASRQVRSGSWSSKIGQMEVIEHDDLRALEGDAYGSVKLIFRRHGTDKPD